MLRHGTVDIGDGRWRICRGWSRGFGVADTHGLHRLLRSRFPCNVSTAPRGTVLRKGWQSCSLLNCMGTQICLGGLFTVMHLFMQAGVSSTLKRELWELLESSSRTECPELKRKHGVQRISIFSIEMQTKGHESFTSCQENFSTKHHSLASVAFLSSLHWDHRSNADERQVSSVWPMTILIRFPSIFHKSRTRECQESNCKQGTLAWTTFDSTYLGILDDSLKQEKKKRIFQQENRSTISIFCMYI